ncbi:unnamed protein product (macronuclear) [Paramecium tetraurelia]|uniref:Signal recognition particle SRP54 subunit M-domain domain-containing protein n=1 Tax=Paramecium tetraurelia TaxID=5888 RepID=A0BR75_PARTE|nr:uncharacterized protein GSPATT00031272001 [Paramecium tetraurelia]CAK61042.1 unnamed protein product [Paramecium tetraurelia]|eukprot:XP_001428440.1 hypothetical protein (macronuclear) [Paramecium tetraurelia strain d4-2]
MIKLFAQKVLQLQFQPLYQFNRFADKLQKKQQDNQKQEFKKELEFLASKPQFTLIDFRQRALDGLHKLKKGFKYQISSGNEETEQQLTLQKQVLNAMFDEELLSPDDLSGDQKKEIAMVAQVEVQQVNFVLSQYSQIRNMHSWVRDMKERGEPMPDNQEDMMYRYKRDKPIKKSFIKFEMKRQNFSMKQRLQKLKWGPRKEV